jgi:rhodanese-related sulfurtransferase
MKARVLLPLLILVLAGAGLLAYVLNSRKGASVDEAAVRKLLADRTRPWFQGHTVPTPRHMHTPFAAPEAMGAFPEPPVKTPVMPPELAFHLAMGRKAVPEGHPFHGRPAALVDMRLRSRHLVEHIPGTLHTVWKDLPDSLKSGPLKDLPRNTIVIVYGDVYPHFEAPLHFRTAGFDAVYCLEGGLQVWKDRGLPVESPASLAEYARQVERERGGPAPPPVQLVEPENIGPAALKTVMEGGLKPLIVFVGDEATFNSGHLPGAIRVPEKEVMERFKDEDKDQLIAVYCGCCEGITKGLSGIAVEQLRGMGFRRLLHLEGHLKAWKELGYPLETAEGEKSGKK